MLGLTTTTTTTTNQFKINIHDELKGIELQMIILPAKKNINDQIKFFSQDELQTLPSLSLDTILEDNEDYSKWQVRNKLLSFFCFNHLPALKKQCSHPQFSYLLHTIRA